MSSDNARVVEQMSEEEREKHRAEILEQFGPEVAELLRRARESRGSNDEGVSVFGVRICTLRRC